MDIWYAIGDFFLSAWLWSITFDWFHPLIAGIIMFLMMRIVLRRKRIQSILVTAGAQFFAMFLLYALVVGVLIGAFNWTYEPYNDARYAISIMTQLYPSLCVGLIYAIFQTIYFLIGSLIWNFNTVVFIMIAWISNGIAMLLSYLFIRMFILWQYS